MLDFFKVGRHYSNQFGNRVWLWKKWVHANKKYRPDEGMDIVVEEKNGDRDVLGPRRLTSGSAVRSPPSHSVLQPDLVTNGPLQSGVTKMSQILGTA